MIIICIHKHPNQATNLIAHRYHDPDPVVDNDDVDAAMVAYDDDGLSAEIQQERGIFQQQNFECCLMRVAVFALVDVLSKLGLAYHCTDVYIFHHLKLMRHRL